MPMLCPAKNPSLEIKYKKKKLDRKSESTSDVDVVKRVITKEYRSKLREKVNIKTICLSVSSLTLFSKFQVMSAVNRVEFWFMNARWL